MTERQDIETDAQGVKRIFKTCQIHKTRFLEAVVDGQGARYTSGCPLCEAEKRTKELFGKALIPSRFQGKTMENYETVLPGQNRALRICQGYLDHFLENASKGHGLFFSGRPGTGKTHLACAVLKGVISLNSSGLYATLEQIFTDVKATWNSNSETQKQYLNRLAVLDLLVIDEIGANRNISAREKEIFFSIINDRYERQKPTVLITNLAFRGEDSFENFVEERIADRIFEACSAVVFDWESYRRKA